MTLSPTTKDSYRDLWRVAHLKLCTEYTNRESTTMFGNQRYNSQLPEAALNTTMKVYPLRNKSKLNTEFSILSSSDEFKICSRAVALYHLFMENLLQDTLSETVALLKILFTSPGTTAESENTEENQDLPQDHTALGSNHCIGHALYGEETCQDFLDFNNRVMRNMHLSRRGHNECTKSPF